MIARRPRRLGDTEASSVPVVAVTALQMLFDHARVVAGQRVLIHGGAGSVGAYAVQLARRAGAHVTATVRDDAAYVTSLGANQVVDGSARFEDVVAPVHAVIDLVGGEVQERSFAVLRHGGTLVSAVSEPDADKAAQHGVRALFMLVRVATAPLARIAAMIDAGELAPRVGTVLPLADARVAHETMEGPGPRPRGKIVLSVAP